MKRYLHLNNNYWECEVHIKNWEFTMNEIEKIIRSYSLFTHKNELYKVGILAGNKPIESKEFSDVFHAYSYMCTTAMHDKINKLSCPVKFRLTCYSSSDNSEIFAIILNSSCELVGVKSYKECVISESFLNTGDIVEFDGKYMVYLGFANNKFHFITDSEFDLTFDKLPTADKIQSDECESDFIKGISFSLQYDPWHYLRWMLDYQIYRNMGREMGSIISQSYKAIKEGKDWFH